MDLPLVILLLLGGLVCGFFGWIYMNTLSGAHKRDVDGSSE